MLQRQETFKRQETNKDDHVHPLKKVPTSFFKSFTSSKRGDNNKDEFVFFERSKECGFYTILYMLVNFAKADELQKRKGFSFIQKEKPIKDMESYTDLSVLRPELIYFFSVISVRDLHDFYIDFYATFDTNKNFSLEKKELTKMLYLMLDLLGEKKFRVFSDVTLIDPDSFEGKLTQRIIDDIAENFEVPDDQNKVDYLQLFPYLFSFYLEYTYQEIKKKQKRLDIMRGTEIIKGKEVEIKNITSLISILREMGVEYLRDKHTYKITYRDVENILIKFKNIQTWMNFEVISQILGSLSKVMQVDSKTQEESKKLKLYKIVEFLTLKLCVHQNCLKIKQQKQNVNQSVFLEILILWNTASYCNFAEQKLLTANFGKYVHSHFPEVESFGRLEVQKCLECYFKKHYQLMPKQQIYDIIQCHKLYKDKSIVKNYKIEKEDLINSLYTMVCTEGFEKLKKYVKIKFDGITKTTTNPHADYGNYGKVIEGDAASIQSSNRKKVMSFEQIPEQKKVKEKKKSSSSSSESDAEVQGNAKQKFKTAVRAVQSGNAIFNEQKADKDILKACLIMDSFLKRQTLRFENKVKETKSLNNSLLRQENQVQESQIQDEEQTIFDPSKQLNEQRKEQKHKNFYGVKKDEQKDWEKEKDVPKKEEKEKAPEEPQEIVVKEKKSKKAAAIQQQQQQQQVVEGNQTGQRPKIDRQQVANELFTVLGKSNNAFGPNDFKKALRLQSSSEVQLNRPLLKNDSQQDKNVVIIDEGALESMIKKNTLQQKARKSTRDDCQCIIF